MRIPTLKDELHFSKKLSQMLVVFLQNSKLEDRSDSIELAQTAGISPQAPDTDRKKRAIELLRGIDTNIVDSTTNKIDSNKFIQAIEPISRKNAREKLQILTNPPHSIAEDTIRLEINQKIVPKITQNEITSVEQDDLIKTLHLTNAQPDTIQALKAYITAKFEALRERQRLQKEHQDKVTVKAGDISRAIAKKVESETGKTPEDRIKAVQHAIDIFGYNTVTPDLIKALQTQDIASLLEKKSEAALSKIRELDMDWSDDLKKVANSKSKFKEAFVHKKNTTSKELALFEYTNSLLLAIGKDGHQITTTDKISDVFQEWNRKKQVFTSLQNANDETLETYRLRFSSSITSQGPDTLKPKNSLAEARLGERVVEKEFRKKGYADNLAGAENRMSGILNDQEASLIRKLDLAMMEMNIANQRESLNLLTENRGLVDRLKEHKGQAILTAAGTAAASYLLLGTALAALPVGAAGIAGYLAYNRIRNLVIFAKGNVALGLDEISLGIQQSWQGLKETFSFNSSPEKLQAEVQRSTAVFKNRLDSTKLQESRLNQRKLMLLRQVQLNPGSDMTELQEIDQQLTDLEDRRQNLQAYIAKMENYQKRVEQLQQMYQALENQDLAAVTRIQQQQIEEQQQNAVSEYEARMSFAEKQNYDLLVEDLRKNQTTLLQEKTTTVEQTWYRDLRDDIRNQLLFFKNCVAGRAEKQSALFARWLYDKVKDRLKPTVNLEDAKERLQFLRLSTHILHEQAIPEPA